MSDAAFHTEHAVRVFLAVRPGKDGRRGLANKDGADRSAFWPGDIVARLVAHGLHRNTLPAHLSWRTSPGAGDNLGTDLVAKATPERFNQSGSASAEPLAIDTLLYARFLRSAHGHRDGDPAERARGQSGARSEFSRRSHGPPVKIREVQFCFDRKRLAIAYLSQWRADTNRSRPYPSSPQAITAGSETMRRSPAFRGCAVTPAGRNGSGERFSPSL